MAPLTEQLLATLLRETKSAHILAFAASNGEDPDWPRWYAQYLAPKLPDLLGRRFDLESLAAELRALDAEHGTLTAPEPWPEFYARSLVSRHSV